MKIFEYKCDTVLVPYPSKPGDRFNDYLNSQGALGWDLVTVIQTNKSEVSLVFKREL